MNFKDSIDYLVKHEDINFINEVVSFDKIPILVSKEEKDKNRAIIFNKIDKFNIKIVANIFGNIDRLLKIFHVDSLSNLFKKVDEAQLNPLPLSFIDSFPHGEIIEPVDDIRKYLPSIKYSKLDKDPYLTSSIVLAKKKNKKGFHICFMRMAIKGENKLSFNPATYKIKKIFEDTITEKEKLDVVILIAPPVEIILLAALSLSENVDEIEVASSLSGGKIDFVMDKIPVPVESEFILWGKVLPTWEEEGPFGDSTGTYSVKKNPVCLIEKIFIKKDPFFYSISGGISNEHIELLSLKAKHRLEKLKELKMIIDYKIPLFAGARLAFLMIGKNDLKVQLFDALKDVPLVKIFILVNKDIDLNSLEDILWGITYRFKPKDFFNFDKKILIDATTNNIDSWENRRIL
ncbi:MAG: hypothetical protein DRG20_06355 [Deltaproteobacteria bacterium]|nr:MAG: hypothetical protein DRG20_06355 [Deltaproteobacteria bacterium]